MAGILLSVVPRRANAGFAGTPTYLGASLGGGAVNKATEPNDKRTIHYYAGIGLVMGSAMGAGVGIVMRAKTRPGRWWV